MQFQAHVNRLTFTQQAEGHFTADWHRTHFRTQGGKAADRFTVQRGDHVTRFNAGFRRRGVRHDLAYECAALSVYSHRFRQLGVQLGTHDTQLTAFHLSILHHLRSQVFHHVARDSKADTDVATVRCQDSGVDTDQFTIQVNQRTAGITTVNGRIRLDEVFIVFRIQAATSQRRDDTRGHGFAQTKRVTDGDGVVTHAQRVRVGKLNRRQVLRILDLNQRDIGARVFTDHFGIEFTAIAHLHLNGVSIIHHVVIGHHVAFGCINNHARAECHEFLLLAAAHAVIPCTAALTERGALEWRTVLAEWRIVAEELLEITRHTRRIDGCAALNVNTHHRWHHFFEHRGQAWHLLRSRCRGSCLGRRRQRGQR